MAYNRKKKRKIEEKNQNIEKKIVHHFSQVNNPSFCPMIIRSLEIII